MTLKSTSTPLDQMLLTEWRTQYCAIEGIDYDDMPAAWQTLFNDTINRAHEYISARAANHPWGQQETTLTVTAGTDTTYSLLATVKRVLSLREEASDGTILNVNYAEKRQFYEAPRGAVGTHPWAISRSPYWFFDGLTSDQPPVQQWRRVGEDNTGATVYVLFRPYFNLLTTSGQDAYAYLPAEESDALLTRIRLKMASASKNWTDVQNLRVELEDDIFAVDTSGRDTAEVPRRVGGDDEFRRQLG